MPCFWIFGSLFWVLLLEDKIVLFSKESLLYRWAPADLELLVVLMTEREVICIAPAGLFLGSSGS